MSGARGGWGEEIHVLGWWCWLREHHLSFHFIHSTTSAKHLLTSANVRAASKMQTPLFPVLNSPAPEASHPAPYRRRRPVRTGGQRTDRGKAEGLHQRSARDGWPLYQTALTIGIIAVTCRSPGPPRVVSAESYRVVNTLACQRQPAEEDWRLLYGQSRSRLVHKTF